eukprot:238026-Amphidinium_carterae.10
MRWFRLFYVGCQCIRPLACIALNGGGRSRALGISEYNPVVMDKSDASFAVNVKVLWTKRAPMLLSSTSEVEFRLFHAAVSQATRHAFARLEFYTDATCATRVLDETILASGSCHCFFVRVACALDTRKRRKLAVGETAAKRRKGVDPVLAAPVSDGGSMRTVATELSPTQSFHSQRDGVGGAAHEVTYADDSACVQKLGRAVMLLSMIVQHMVGLFVRLLMQMTLLALEVQYADDVASIISLVRPCGSEGSLADADDLQVAEARRALDDKVFRVLQVRQLLDTWRHVRLQSRASCRSLGSENVGEFNLAAASAAMAMQRDEPGVLDTVRHLTVVVGKHVHIVPVPESDAHASIHELIETVARLLAPPFRFQALVEGVPILQRMSVARFWEMGVAHVLLVPITVIHVDLVGRRRDSWTRNIDVLHPESLFGFGDWYPTVSDGSCFWDSVGHCMSLHGWSLRNEALNLLPLWAAMLMIG